MKTIIIQISAREASAATRVLKARGAGNCYATEDSTLAEGVLAKCLRAYIITSEGSAGRAATGHPKAAPRARKRALAGTLVP